MGFMSYDVEIGKTCLYIITIIIINYSIYNTVLFPLVGMPKVITCFSQNCSEITAEIGNSSNETRNHDSDCLSDAHCRFYIGWMISVLITTGISYLAAIVFVIAHALDAEFLRENSYWSWLLEVLSGPCFFQIGAICTVLLPVIICLAACVILLGHFEIRKKCKAIMKIFSQSKPNTQKQLDAENIEIAVEQPLIANNISSRPNTRSLD